MNPTAGLSSYGGLIGGTLGFFAFALSTRVKRLRYADAALIATSVHDHVGVASCGSPVRGDGL